MGGCYTGVDELGRQTARRALVDKLREPPYQLSAVPRCNRELEGSVIPNPNSSRCVSRLAPCMVLVKPPTQACWSRNLSELLLLCNEAAARNAKRHPEDMGKKKDADGTQTKPLGLEYISDRIETDDPIWGYMVRTAREGWLQGFITLTTFTTWHTDFEFNSLVQEAAISDQEKREHRWDSDNCLSLELQAQEHAGDPNGEGIIWKRVAEISLLGAMGCGGQLVKLACEEMEAGEQYDYVVLQATENAVKFYEAMGFIRVGTIARPDLEAVARKQAEAQARKEAMEAAREKERDAKKAARIQQRTQQEIVARQTVREHAGTWRKLCAIVIRSLLLRVEPPKSAKVNKVGKGDKGAKATAPGIMGIPRGVAALVALEEASVALDTGCDVSGSLSLATVEQTVTGVWKLLTEAADAAKTGSVEAEGWEKLREEFAQAWLAYAPTEQLASGQALAARAAGQSISTPSPSGLGKFCVYVDLDWEGRHGFKLFEILAEGAAAQPGGRKSAGGADKDADTTGTGPPKGVVLAREWQPSRELAKGADPQIQEFVSKQAKGTRLSWTARRECGALMTETIPVSVVALRSVVAEKNSGGGGATQVPIEAVCIVDQGETVAVAYAKLRAMRTLEELQRDDTTKQTDEDGGGVKEEGAVEMVSDYERQRHARMAENNRILMMTGILEASEEMIEQSTPSQHLGSGGSEKKRKRDGQSDADDEEVMKREMRLRGAKEDLGNPSQDHRMDDGSEGGGDRSSGLPPSGQLSRGEGQVRPEGERERALSDVDTPVKQVEESAAVLLSKRDPPPIPEGAEPFPENGTHKAVENETPRNIAKLYGLQLNSLVQMNRADFSTLNANSRFRNGTIVRLPRPGDVATAFIPAKDLGRKGGGWSAYCHWTYPDQENDDIFPSYMMAKRLSRTPRATPQETSAEAVAMAPPPPGSMRELLASRMVRIPPPVLSARQLQEKEEEEAAAARQAAPAPEMPPGWPEAGVYECGENDRVISVAKRFEVNVDKLVQINKTLYPGLNKTVALKKGTKLRLPPPLGQDQPKESWFEPVQAVLNKLLGARHSGVFASPVEWDVSGSEMEDYPFIISHPMDLGTIEAKLLSDQYRSVGRFAADVRLVFSNAMEYNPAEDIVHTTAAKLLAAFESHWRGLGLDKLEAQDGRVGSASGTQKKPRKKRVMFNKVVVIEGSDPRPGLFFVLHYIPDMEWCHLCEMRQVGVFPDTYKNGNRHIQAGRPCWMLAPEGEGEELDVSADRCRIIKTVTVNRTADADKEAWDIQEEIPADWGLAGSPPSKWTLQNGTALVGKQADSKGPKSVKEAEDRPTVPSAERAAPHSGKDKSASSVRRDATRSSTKRSALASGFEKEAAEVLRKLQAHPRAAPFLEPLDTISLQLFDYFEVVSRAMDLGTVGKQLKAGRYATAASFLTDTRLTFENAVNYNEEGSKVHKAALALLAALDQLCDSPRMSVARAFLCDRSAAVGGVCNGEHGEGAPPAGGGQDSSASAAAPDLQPSVGEKRLREDQDPASSGRSPARTPRGATPRGTPTRTPAGRNAAGVEGSRSTNGTPSKAKRSILGEGEAGNSGVQGKSEEDAESSAEAQTIAAAQAETVSGPARQNSGKVTAALLDKIATHASARILKFTAILPQADVTRLFQALADNKSTTSLDMEGCGIGDAGCAALAALLDRNKRIQELDLQMNQISDEGAEALAAALPASGVRQLLLKCNDISEHGGRALIEATLEQRRRTGQCAVLSGLAEGLMAQVAASAAAEVKGSAAARGTGGFEALEAIDEAFESHLAALEAKEAEERREAQRAKEEAARAREASAAAAREAAQARRDAREVREERALLEAVVDWRVEAQGLLRKIKGNAARAAPFLEPLDPVALGLYDYFAIVRRPMDLGTVERRLAAAEYDGPAAFVAELRLVFDNAMLYNPVENKVHKMAASLLSLLQQLCLSSRVLGEAFQESRNEADAAGAAGATGAGGFHAMADADDADLDTPAAHALRAAGAKRRSGEPRTASARVSAGLLKKVAAHQSGTVLKITDMLPPKELARLADALSDNLSTERLDLEGCGVQDEGCRALAALLRANKRIEDLDLQLNQISDAGVAHLAAVLPHTGLRALRLADNSVSAAGAAWLMDAATEQRLLSGRIAQIYGLSDEIMAPLRLRQAEQLRRAAQSAGTSGVSGAVPAAAPLETSAIDAPHRKGRAADAADSDAIVID